jgi:hypothetical protein
MKKLVTLLGPAIAVILTFAGTGYAATQAESAPFGDYEPKGFLSDYSKFEPEGGDSEAYVYKNPGIDRSRYNKVMVDRIKMFLAEDADYKGIDPTELKELADYFHEAIVKALGPEYPVVEEAGPDVVRLRIAVTDIIPTKPEASVVTLVVPFLWAGEAGAGVAEGEAGSTPFVGEATVEMEALDSSSSEQIGAYIEHRLGKKYHWTKGVDTAVKDYLKAYSTWAYTKQAMDVWAQLVRQRMDEMHGKGAARDGEGE